MSGSPYLCESSVSCDYVLALTQTRSFELVQQHPGLFPVGGAAAPVRSLRSAKVDMDIDRPARAECDRLDDVLAAVAQVHASEHQRTGEVQNWKTDHKYSHHLIGTCCPGPLHSVRPRNLHGHRFPRLRPAYGASLAAERFPVPAMVESTCRLKFVDRLKR